MSSTVPAHILATNTAFAVNVCITTVSVEKSQPVILRQKRSKPTIVQWNFSSSDGRSKKIFIEKGG